MGVLGALQKLQPYLVWKLLCLEGKGDVEADGSSGQADLRLLGRGVQREDCFAPFSHVWLPGCLGLSPALHGRCAVHRRIIRPPPAGVQLSGPRGTQMALPATPPAPSDRLRRSGCIVLFWLSSARSFFMHLVIYF